MRFVASRSRLRRVRCEIVNTQISAYYNVARPDFAANWQIRAQLQLMFPKDLL